MKLQLDFHPEISNEKIQIGNKIILLGSCFSDEIAIRMRNSGFHVVANPFGTIFHPTALANLLLTTDVESSVIKRDDLFFSWLAAGSVYSVGKESLVAKLLELQNYLIESIRTSSFLFVTFGTAFAYEHEKYVSVVAIVKFTNLALFVVVIISLIVPMFPIIVTLLIPIIFFIIKFTPKIINYLNE